MLCPISVLLSFCYSFYVVLNTDWNQNGERMVSETLTSATVIIAGMSTDISHSDRILSKTAELHWL